MPAAEIQQLRDRCRQYAADGRFELYKLSLRFDNPEGRLAHGFPLDMQLHRNLWVARGFRPFSAAGMQPIRDACRLNASDGHMELFKTTRKYDGDLGREKHGFPSNAEIPVLSKRSGP